MLEHIKREMRYIKTNQYGFKTTITIDGKEYCESELCADNEYTIYPEPLEDQLQRLIPDVDVEFIEEFVDNVKSVVTSDDLEDVQKTWDALVRVQELINKFSKDSDTDKFSRMYRTLVKAHGKIFYGGKDICEEYTKKSERKECPLYKDGKCMLNSTFSVLNSLRAYVIGRRI